MELILPQNWNQGKASRSRSCITVCLFYLKIGTKAKLLRGKALLHIRLFYLKIGTKAKP